MKFARLVTFAVVALPVLAGALPVSAQEDIAQYRQLRHYEPMGTWKVGDKVDARDYHGNYRPATILKIDDQSGYPYRLHWDDTPSSDDMVLPPSMIRARSGAAVSGNEAVRKELGAYKPLPTPARGSLEATFQDMIRARYTGDREVRVVFHGFKIGQTHKYRPPGLGYDSPDGPHGYIGATIYPVSAQYTVRSTYADAYLTSVHDERFACFKDSFKKWTCNLMSGGRGITKNLREVRADSH